MMYGLEMVGGNKETSRRDGSSRDENVEVCYGSDEKRLEMSTSGVQLR